MKKKLLYLVLTLMTVFALTGCSLALRAEVPYQSPTPYEQLRIDMIATVEESVVAVKTETGHGSGIIFKSEPVLESSETLYYVMTNYHVVEDGGEMTVHFGADQTDIPVVDFAGYELYDIAVVRFQSSKTFRVHNVAPINDNTITEIIKGQDVYAIGSPQNLDKFNYVTQGIVSLATFPYNGVVGLAIMHDAELNPGNSGGPLFNLNGELIGINVAKIPTVSSKTGTIAAEGLNYSLSINKIAPIIRSFTENDYQEVVRKPRLGISVQEVDIFLDPNNVPPNDPALLPPNPVGVVVVGFDQTRNAKDFLELYDLIIEMNGTPITSIADIGAQLTDAEFGDQHVLKVLRKVGDSFVELTFTIILS
ncbi:MAG: trypsin-like peptidase domain-containing protein [Firmicutes bacterium]|nr:trypsin-like peptidase domain-containing protein [Bacillota bacterium]